MHGFFERMLFGKTGPVIMALTLVLICIIVATMPIKADTPTLSFVGDDKAPGTIYLGDIHAEEMHDIVMLQITANTTYSQGATLNGITIYRTGTAMDADAENISLYEDYNHNGELDHSIDVLLSTTEFEQGWADFSVSRNVTPTDPLSLLVALNISGEAASGSTIGVAIPNEDNITTQEPANIEFVFPMYSKNSTIHLDIDGDLNPDETDPDDDNDGYIDEVEGSCGSDPKDSSSVPKDTDKDFVPDSIDTDDDNDGVPDEFDDFPLDANRQRDYTMVYIYAVIATVLIIGLILLTWKKRRMRDFDEKELLDLDDFDEEEIDKLLEDEDEIDRLLEDEEDFNEDEIDKLLEDGEDFDGEELSLSKP